MNSSRRRTRRPDPLASPEAVRRILDQLCRRCPRILPKSERQIMKMLESVRHYERHPAVAGNRGRPRRWPLEDVEVVTEKLTDILERKTEGRVSLSSFVSLYLRILRYPVDVTNALSEGAINIREAAYLARLTPERMNCSPPQSRELRKKLLEAHLLTQGSQSSMRQRVKAALGEWPEAELKRGKTGRQKADELLVEDPYDARHLFYEEIQHLTDAMRQVDPEDLKGKSLSEFLRQIDKLLSMLRRVKKRGRT